MTSQAPILQNLSRIAPLLRRSLVGDPMFVQCCVDAGVNPFDLFPHVADEVSTRSASKSRHGHESMHSRASIDSLLKSQCRPTVLSIGPEMLANPASRKQVRSKVAEWQYVDLCCGSHPVTSSQERGLGLSILLDLCLRLVKVYQYSVRSLYGWMIVQVVCAILREYEEARRTEAIRQREEEKRGAKSRVFVEHVAGYYAAVMANQRARSQGLLERVHRLRVRQSVCSLKGPGGGSKRSCFFLCCVAGCR